MTCARNGGRVAGKRPKNLLLDIAALNRGEDYCKRHGTTLSRLVEDFLLALPEREIERMEEVKSPIVQRMLDSSRFGRSEVDTYRDFIFRKREEEHARFGRFRRTR